MDAGADGIVISNHGGRQIDGSVPALWALEQICQSPKVRAAQRDGTFTVLFDSGIRTGTDIFRALALGAQGVLRAYFHDLYCSVHYTVMTLAGARTDELYRFGHLESVRLD